MDSRGCKVWYAGDDPMLCSFCGALTESHHQRTDDILTNRQTPSQPQLPGHVLQLTFRTHYLT